MQGFLYEKMLQGS
jgi:hypothetical protein